MFKLYHYILVKIQEFLGHFWRKPTTFKDIQEWGIGGRRFGTVVVWFLLGGDLYTAFSVAFLWYLSTAGEHNRFSYSLSV